MFENPTQLPFIEHHNDMVVKHAGLSLIRNATKLWEEIFQQDESDWPSVTYFLTGFAHHHNHINQNTFMFDYHVELFMDMLPPMWHGTMLLGDHTLSGREGGYVSTPQYKEFLKSINTVVNLLGNNPRVCWIEGHGISKEMRIYSQDGKEYVAWLQHLNSYCMNTVSRDLNKRYS
jgi:hypothetical protein